MPVLLAVSLCLPAGAGADDPLRIGLYENVPKVGTGDDGAAGGVFVELLDAIARREHWRLEYVSCEWSACLEALEAGEIDLMPDVALTPERRESLAFHSIPVAQAWSQVLAPIDSGLDRIEALEGLRLAVLDGSIQYDYLREYALDTGLDWTLVTRGDMESVLAAVASGDADVAITNNFYARRHARQHMLVETPVTFDQVGLYYAAAPGRQDDRLEVIDAYLQRWKGDAGSPYQHAMEQALEPPLGEGEIPTWAWSALASAAVIALVLGLMAVWLRRTVRAQTRALREANQRLEHLLESGPVVLYQLNALDFKPLWVSGNFERLFGFNSRVALQPGWWEQQVHPEDRATAMRENRRLQEERHMVRELRLFDGWGKLRHIRDEMRIIPGGNQGQRGAEVVGSWTDLTASMEQKEALRQMAHYDARTGLPNRVLLHDRLGHTLERAMADGLARWVVLIDLDRFRNVNETLGTSAGDRVLEGLAERLGGLLGPHDTVSRVGADEFCLIIENPPMDGGAEAFLEQLLETLREPCAIGGRTLVTTASVGLATFPEHGNTRDELLTAAELAMAASRSVGGDTWHVYEPGMGAQTEHRLFLENDLRSAIANDELLLYFQPQLEMQSGRLVGMEALVRWRHPVRGMVSPAEFIPLAEETGMIQAIDRWVLNAACAQLAHWDQDGRCVPTVAVNLSARELHDETLVAAIQEILEHHGLEPDRLELELTETMMMEQPERALAVLHRLETLGVTLAMDDFGAGYSNLAHLRRLPLRRLKIDQSLVRDIGHSRNNESIIRAIIALADALGLDLIAEGVEEAGQQAFLLREGCRFGQGYLLGRPAPADNALQGIGA
ncbi:MULTISPECIES: EAL domain-containing protein [unclassified Thioalkalivibrio]|uniref:EAL domain-containing protein n=1 Tax=unclassified Thioalkalivibrio TaxID=2621013 RepID=UPI00037D231D|nr:MULTISPECIES: EAL domain-containing protein [unclassified Thioalkalivibrio]